MCRRGKRPASEPRGRLCGSRPDTQPARLGAPWLCASCVFVHPRTVDIDCAGDRLRHISTQLALAAEKHINWLHWEPCLVTMVKHTGWEEAAGWDGAAGSARRLSGVVFLKRSFPFPPATSVIVSQPLLSHTDSFSLSLFVSHINTFAYFFFLCLRFFLLTLTLPHSPPPYPATKCNIICLPLVVCRLFFFWPSRLGRHDSSVKTGRTNVG